MCIDTLHASWHFILLLLLLSINNHNSLCALQCPSEASKGKLVAYGVRVTEEKEKEKEKDRVSRVGKTMSSLCCG